MKRSIYVIIISIVFVMISGCADQNQQSNINSNITTVSENIVIKDDAYYENLIKDIKYPEIYHVQSDAYLMDIVGMFVYRFDMVFSNTEFLSTQELGDNKIFYAHPFSTAR